MIVGVNLVGTPQCGIRVKTLVANSPNGGVPLTIYEIGFEMGGNTFQFLLPEEFARGVANGIQASLNKVLV